MPLALYAGRFSARALLLGSTSLAALLTLGCTDLSTPDRAVPAIARRSVDSLGPVGPRTHHTVPGQYIVVFNSDVQDAPGLAKALVAAHGGAVIRTYSHALRGFAARLPDAAADALANNPNVQYVEQDALVDVENEESPVPSWGLDRIDQRKGRLDSKYDYISPAGNGVNVYIIDTGIRTSHVDFGGRAFEAYTTVTDSLGAQDCLGHGTHVAGTVGGTAYGVAKSVRLYSVRVIPCSGSAPMSDLIAALDWVATNRVLPAVVNMSLSGEYSDAANQAVAAVVATGATVVAAAGNDFADACSFSPGSAPTALTVGATNASDMQAAFSNSGPCVDLFAPGVQIKSAYIGTDTSTLIMAGTSMAAPHVAGTAALYLSVNPTATPAGVAQAIVGSATSGILTNLGAGSPNLLLYSGGISGVITAPAPTPTDNPPTASFTISCVKTACRFDGTGSTDDIGIAGYSWDFGDGSAPVTNAPSITTHSYAGAGAYTVALTVTDTGGHTTRVSHVVRVKK